MGRRHRDILSLCAARSDSKDPLTNSPRVDAIANEVYLACEFKPGNVLGIIRWRRIEASPLKQIGAIESRSFHAHTHLVSAWLRRRRDVADLEYFRTTE